MNAMLTHQPVTLPKLMSVADYLERELTSEIKHEYIGGMIYAMAGATIRHNILASNSLGLLHARLRGKPCQPFNSDTKVRIQSSTQTRFYYPDVQVVCRSNADEETFQDSPILVMEVLSPSTRRIDEGEKKDAYLTIPTLSIYLLVEPNQPGVVAYRRAEQGFERQGYQGLGAVIPLPEIESELPLAEIYEGVHFEAAAGSD